jgi:hypothetical protein
MDAFRTAVGYMAVAALLLAALQVYLVANKLWKRKHEKQVAESISIMGECLGVVPLMVLTLNFALDGHWVAVADTTLWLLAGAFAITVGSGRWVEGRRGLGFFRLLRDSVSQERGEVGHLARSFFRPASAHSVLHILAQVALLDDHLDEREKKFIDAFASSWGVSFSWDEVQRSRSGADLDFIRLRNDVAEYLATAPPADQVRQLSDVVQKLSEIDDEVADAEALMVSEVTGMMSRYLSTEADAGPLYHLVIVPQEAEQDAAIAAVLPDVEKRELNGGQVYVVGRYHSFDFAEIVSAQYRALHFFTAVVRVRGVDAGLLEPRAAITAAAPPPA